MKNYIRQMEKHLINFRDESPIMHEQNRQMFSIATVEK